MSSIRSAGALAWQRPRWSSLARHSLPPTSAASARPWWRGPDGMARALTPDFAKPFSGPLPEAPRWRRYVLGYSLVLPAVALVFGLLVYPLLVEVQLSLTDAQTSSETAAFVGLRNYAAIVADAGFWQAIRNTTFLMLVTTTAQLLLGVSVALLLWRRSWLRPVLFAMVFLPWIYPSSFANYTWYWILLPPFHTFYTLDVIQARFWLEGMFGEQAWQILSFALMCTWRGSSIVAILLLAGLRAVPRDLLD